MARFGQGFINSLINPSYADQMSQVGMLGGSLMGRRRAAEEAKAKEAAEKLQQQQQQAAIMSAYGMAQKPGGSDPAAAMSAMAQGIPGLQAKELISAADSGRSVAKEKQAQAEAKKAEAQRVAQQKALAQFLGAKGNQELADLANAGVVTPKNYKDFLDDSGKPVPIGPGDRLVDPVTGRTIAKNPKTNGLETKDYSLTGAEVETYESIIESNEDISEALEGGGWTVPEDVPFVGGKTFLGGTDKDKMRIAIDRAEMLRTQNPRMTKEEALRTALMSQKANTEDVAPNDWYNTLSAPLQQKVDVARSKGVSDEEIKEALGIQ